MAEICCGNGRFCPWQVRSVWSSHVRSGLVGVPTGSCAAVAQVVGMTFMLLTVFTLNAAEPRREIVIDAADLGQPEARSEEPVPGKWWLNRKAQDWGVGNGT